MDNSRRTINIIVMDEETKELLQKGVKRLSQGEAEETQEKEE